MEFLFGALIFQTLWTVKKKMRLCPINDIFFERELALLVALQVFGSKGEGGREGGRKEEGELFNKNL